MTAMQLDWKFGPKGLKELGDKKVLVCVLRSRWVCTRKASYLNKPGYPLEGLAWTEFPACLEIAMHSAQLLAALHGNEKSQST